MKTQLLILAIAAGAGLSLTPAVAQERAPTDFATLDTDGDGQITIEDFEAARAERFAAADTDGDGVLSEAELIAQVQERAADRASTMVARMLERLDANEDGVLGADEMQDARGDRMARRFERVDTDADGAISEEEFEAAANDRGRRGGRDGHGRHDGKGHGRHSGRG